MPDKVLPLADAVRDHVRAGDVVHVMTGHTRWTAAAASGPASGGSAPAATSRW